MKEIPNDIIETQILPKIPIDLLPNFKSVSKSFNSLISNPDFVTGRLIILNVTGEGFHVFDLEALHSPPFFLPFPSRKKHKTHVYGSCNGLLCFGPNENELLLLNPLTGVFFNIPSFVLPESKYAQHNIGFGFDDLSDDYKIVQIVSRRKSFDVSLYSLKANSWKVVKSSSDSSPSQGPLKIRGDGALIDKHLLHWIFVDTKKPFRENNPIRIVNIRRIGCFDIRTEQWVDNVALPRDYDTNTDCNRHHEVQRLGVFDGCLCLLTPSKLDLVSTHVDMWVMKEYGVEDSWVKVVGEVSDPGVTLSLRMCPLVLRHGTITDLEADTDTDAQHEILMSRGSRHTLPHAERVVLIWYDLKRKRSRLSEVHKLHGFPQHFTDVCVCTKSLVTLPGGSQIPKENKYPS